MILFCSLILSYFQVWGNSSVTHAKPLYASVKRAIRLINKVDEQKHSNRLFIVSHVMKFEDLVDLKTLSITCKDRNQQEIYRGCLYQDQM